MGACAVPEQASRDDASVVENQQLVSVQQVWKVAERGIATSASATIHHQQTRTVAPV
jgi:hypothetical protein